MDKMEEEKKTKYSKGKIYKIVSTLPEHAGKCYVGSTIHSLNRRMCNHNQACFIKQKQGKLYQTIRQHSFNDFLIEKIEDFPCNTLSDLRKREDYWIIQLDSINTGWNKKRAFITPEEMKTKKREDQRVRRKLPEVELKEKAYRQRPDVKARVNEKRKQRLQNPEVKAKINEQQRQRYHEAKLRKQITTTTTTTTVELIFED